MILRVFTVSGHSMLPALNPKDKILVSNFFYHFIKPKIGDIILFKKDGKSIIKRISKINNGRISVSGDNKDDSSYNLIISEKDIMGKVIYKFQ